MDEERRFDRAASSNIIALVVTAIILFSLVAVLESRPVLKLAPPASSASQR